MSAPVTFTSSEILSVQREWNTYCEYVLPTTFVTYLNSLRDDKKNIYISNIHYFSKSAHLNKNPGILHQLCIPSVTVTSIKILLFKINIVKCCKKIDKLSIN